MRRQEKISRRQEEKEDKRKEIRESTKIRRLPEKKGDRRKLGCYKRGKGTGKNRGSHEGCKTRMGTNGRLEFTGGKRRQEKIVEGSTGENRRITQGMKGHGNREVTGEKRRQQKFRPEEKISMRQEKQVKILGISPLEYYFEPGSLKVIFTAEGILNPGY
ncbi:hypothetical protein QAD02_014918 [Eretmocerus hayati]|uniref:Uncharacterized protein n=1 Tax=Eretmocerus hayati TaxID=131215 RepID=A0ACC2P6S7_9HYME|nr:hypothetical protein QAD02_014918 [Eretmocerus hayati]